MKNTLFFLSLLVSFQIAYGQSVLTNRPEQDCPGALPICDSFFTQPNSYTGPGSINVEFNDTLSCLKNGKNNCVWYTFTTIDSGILQFSLCPNVNTDDYDFALFNITGHTCADILNMTEQLEVRCNYTLNDSTVGPCTGIGNYYGGYDTVSPASGPAFNWSDTVDGTPQTFVMIVNDFSSGGSGYIIDFGRSTTRFGGVNLPLTINNNKDTVCQGANSIILTFSPGVLCNSVTAACCSLSGLVNDSIVQAFAINCEDATTADSIMVQFSNGLPAGDFSIILNDSTLSPYGCGLLLPSTDTLHVHVLAASQAGFSVNLSSDTAYITTTALGVDSVNYSLISSANFDTLSYPNGTQYIVLPEGDDYLLCQHVFSGSACFNATDSCLVVNLDGISSAPFSTYVSLVPNPTTGMVKVQLPNANITTYLQVYNILGMLIGEQQIQAGTTSAELDLNNDAAGTYLVKLRQGNEQCMKKVVKY